MGLTFNGQHSGDFGVYFKTTAIPYIAPKRASGISVQGRDGQYVFEDGYDNFIIELSCVIVAARVFDRRIMAREVAGWLANTGTLIFDNEYDVEYKVVKVTNNIAAAMDGSADQFTIAFECEPFKEQVFYNEDLTWGGVEGGWGSVPTAWAGYGRTFTVSTGETITVTNAGTYKALPTIRLTGNEASVTIGGFTITNLAGTIYIDCRNLLVYEIIGSAKINRISDFTGEFPVLYPGDNDFLITGATGLEIEFDYKNTYL